MITPRTLVHAVVGSVLAAQTAIAAPSYSTPLDEYTLERAAAELEQLAATEGISSEAAKLVLRLDVFATSNDTGCPGVDVDVVNATNRTVWHVTVNITQKDGSNERTETVHLPYMTKNTKTRVTVSCLQDYSYSRSRYGYGNAPIQLSYEASGAKSIDDALPLMLAQTIDYVSNGGIGVSPTTSGYRNLLEDALVKDDEEVAKELVLAIARTGVGKEALGKTLELNATGAIADEVVASLKKLPAAQQAQLARTLLASPAAMRWKDKLVPMIDRQLCTARGVERGDVVGLWLTAQSRAGIPVEELRARVAEKCKPTGNDAAGFVAAIDKTTSFAGALDAVDAPLFAAIVAQWKAVKPPSIDLRTASGGAARPASAGLAGHASHTAFMRYTANAERFAMAAEALQPVRVSTAMLETLLSEDNAASDAKAAWLARAIPALEPALRSDAVVEATHALVNGSIPAPKLRETVKGFRQVEPAAVEEVLKFAAAQKAQVFDPQKLQGIDMADYLAFEASLGDCGASINTLDTCAKKIAANPALAKQTRTAVRPEFEAKMRELVGNLRNEEGLIAIANELRAAGFAVGFVAENACRDARNAMQYSGGDPDRFIALAEKIDRDAPCIESVRDEATAKDRRALKFAILAILGLVLPLPIGGFLAKRRWKKVQAALPPDATDDTAAGEKLDDRLGAQGLGRALRDGLAEAKRDLPDVRGLAVVDDAIVFAVQGTVKRAVKTGDAATVIVKRAAQGDAVYIVALPVSQPRPQVVVRYLGAPWPEHVAQIQRAAQMPVLALLVFCAPDAAEATLLVGTETSVPDVVLDAKEARDRGANRFRFTATISSDKKAA